MEAHPLQKEVDHGSEKKKEKEHQPRRVNLLDLHATKLNHFLELRKSAFERYRLDLRRNQ